MLAMQDLLAQCRHDGRLQRWECVGWRGVCVQRWLLRQRRDVLAVQDMPCSQCCSHILVCCRMHCRHCYVRV